LLDQNKHIEGNHSKIWSTPHRQKPLSLKQAMHSADGWLLLSLNQTPTSHCRNQVCNHCQTLCSRETTSLLLCRNRGLPMNLFPIKTSSWLSIQNRSWILREQVQCQSPLIQFRRERSNIQVATLLKRTTLILVKVFVIESMREMNSESITLATILFNKQTYLWLLTTVPNPSWLLSWNLREIEQLHTIPASWLLHPSIPKYPFTSATIAEYFVRE
jgi:hypothetical protein